MIDACSPGHFLVCMHFLSATTMVKSTEETQKENVPTAIDTTTTAAAAKKAKGDAKESSNNVKTKPPGAKKAFWTAADDVAFVEQLKHERAEANQADNSWKGPVWTRCAEKLNKIKTKGADKTAHGCKDHWSSVSPPP